MAESASERRASSEKVQQAIEEYMSTIDFGAQGVIGDWMVIGTLVYVDESQDEDAQYFMAFRGGSMLQHHVLGLLEQARNMLNDGDCDPS